MYTELDIKVEMPARGNAYGIACRVAGYEPAFGNKASMQSFSIASLQWKTYSEVLDDDVLHAVHNVWITGSDLLDLIERVGKLIEEMS